MKKIERKDVLHLAEYERVRESERARIIDLKRDRRLAVGETLSFLFENRETVLYQIHEMLRTERIVDEGKIREEIEAYNALIPNPGHVSATLFIEIPDLHLLGHDEVRAAVNRFQGLDRNEAVRLDLGGRARLVARFEGGHSKEEKMAAVHYLRFTVPPPARALLADLAESARLVVDHPNCQAAAELPEELRRELLRDLGAEAPLPEEVASAPSAASARPGREPAAG